MMPNPIGLPQPLLGSWVKNSNLFGMVVDGMRHIDHRLLSKSKHFIVLKFGAHHNIIKHEL